jgi:hypothetical protein
MLLLCQRAWREGQALGMHQRRVEHLKRPLVCSWDDGLVRLLCMLLRTTRTLTDYCEPWIRTLNDYYGEARGIGVSYKSGYGVSSEFGAFDLAGYEERRGLVVSSVVA